MEVLFIVNKGYLICEKCKGYYELRENESPNDFDRCQCGGNLKYITDINDLLHIEYTGQDNVRESIRVGKTFTEQKAEEYLNRRKSRKESIKNGNKKLGSSYTLQKSTKKFKNKKKTDSLYKKYPSKTFEPLYISIGLFIILIGLILILFNLLIAIILIIIGVIFAGYGAYEPSDTYSKNQTSRYYRFGIPGSSQTYKQIKREKKRGENYVKGLDGENMVLKQLNTLPKDFFVFHDVKLPKGRGNIDHIIVGPTGLFVIETKNYSGKYRIDGNQWYYYKNGQYNKIDKDPGKQLIRNILDLKSLLKTKGIKSQIYADGIIAFVQNNYSITQEPKNYKVFAPAMIPDYIISKQKNSDLKTLAKIAQEIEPYCTELTYVPK